MDIASKTNLFNVV